MKLDSLLRSLKCAPETALHMMLPSGAFVPAHFHVTEVGRVTKSFIDCGGTVRESVVCSLQIWTADDTQHRLTAGKLVKILNLAQPLLRGDDLDVEVEYGEDVASLYQLAGVEITPKGLLFILAGKKTACLAPDKCGVGECNTAGCC